MPSHKPSLAETHPELAAQADGWDPTTLSRGSTKKVGWNCELGHKWESTVNNRSNNESGCPYCSGNKVQLGFNDLATTNPKLASQADGWDPTTLPQMSHKKVRWLGTCGHKWKGALADRSRGHGCPVCAGKKVQVGFNDLATINPALATEADGWDPTTVTAGSPKKVQWLGTCGHKWSATILSRTSQSNSCPFCSGHRVLAGFNDLATINPALATEADGWDPRTVTAWSRKKVGWKCSIGHHWTAKVAGRSRGTGCPVCAGLEVQIGFNDLATTHPELASQAVGWNPQTVVAGTHKKFRWKCDFGHAWKAEVNSRSYGSGCPTCAKFGFDPNQPGWLYFIDNFDLQMFQIGITNSPDRRLGIHKRRNWEVIEVRGPMDGHLTQKLETDCLHAVEKRGAVLGHKAGIEKFDGYTEAWTKKSLNVTSIKQILDWVYEDEGVRVDF